MSEHRWIIGKNCQVKILQEFSASELLGIVFARRSEEHAIVPLTANELREMKCLELDGERWKVLYTRRECNDGNSYLATALAWTGGIRESHERAVNSLEDTVAKLRKEVFGPKP